mgnify:CR=1 FL=1
MSFKNQHRKYKIISGVAYPHLISGKNKTKLVKANVFDKNEYYYDEAIRLSEKDVSDFNQLVGQPLCVEHDESIQVGEISKTWTDKKGQLRFMARLYVDTPQGIAAHNSMNRGELSGISVGYSPMLDRETMTVNGKVFKEVSLCRQGFFPGAQVSVRASANRATLTEKMLIFFKISAMQEEKTEQSPEPIAEVVEKTTHLDENTDAVELARQTDEMLKENEILKQKLAESKARDERLAKLEKAEQERAKKYAEAREGDLQKVLEIQRQQYKDINGDDAVLPESYEKTAAIAFKNEQTADFANAITASALYSQKKDEELTKLRAELEAAKTKVKSLSDVNKVAMTHVAASRRNFGSSSKKDSNPDKEKTELKTDVKASGESTFNMLFSPASDAEAELYIDNYGRTMNDSTDIQASNADTPKYEPIPVHAHVDKFPNSMRNHFPGLFSHMVKHDIAAEPFIKLEHTYETL